MMTKQEKEKFSNILTSIAIACGKEISNKLTFEVYFKALEDLSLAEIELGGTTLLKAWDKPGMLPTPGQFREAIVGDPASRSSVALETLKTAMQKSGAYKSVSFADPALIVAIEHHGDWVEICLAYNELRDQDVSFWEHNFRQVYQQAVKRVRQPSQRYLMGISEMQNSATVGQFTRGKLPEPEVDLYGVDQKLKRLPLAEIAPHAFLVGVSQKLLETKEDSALPEK